MKLISVFVLVAFLASALSAPYYGKFSSVDEMIAYVESIELAQPKFSPLSNSSFVKVGIPPDNKPQGAVVGGAVTAFTENVKGQSKQDVLDGTLFAQLAANKKYDREKDTKNWYAYYVNVLTNIGFQAEGFNFVEYNTKGNSFTMDKAVLEILAAIATGGESAVITATLSALEGMADSDGRITLFSQQSSSYNSGNFQIYPCEQDANGDVAMAMAALYFTASQHHTNFLFFSYGSSNSHLYDGANKIILNTPIYQNVRSTISSKLGRNAIDFVALIDI